MSETTHEKPTPGSVAISYSTAMSVNLLGRIDYTPAELAIDLIALDTFLQGIVTFERVYAISPVFPGVNSPLIPGHPEIPVETVFPPGNPPEMHSMEAFKQALLADPAFAKLMKLEYGTFNNSNTFRSEDEYVEATATITAGDLWRARGLELPFLASQLESGLCLEDQLGTPSARLPGVQGSALELIHSAWAALAGDANRLKNQPFFSTRMPLLLLTVLRECQTIDDVWRVAMQLRTTKEARAFREWAVVVERETDVRVVAGHMREVTSLVDDLFRVSGSRSFDVSFGIGFPPSISLSGAPVRFRFKRERPHLRFLRRLAGDALAASRIEPHVVRVLEASKNVAANSIALLSTTTT